MVPEGATAMPVSACQSGLPASNFRAPVDGSMRRTFEAGASAPNAVAGKPTAAAAATAVMAAVPI